MEENLMEKLLENFNSTLNEFNELVVNNDFDAVKRVLSEVNRLISERDGIVLDEEPEYDHVLHKLLDKMTGIVEKEIIVQGIDGKKGSRYYTNEQVQKMIEEAENELQEITRMVNTYKDVDDASYAQARSDRSKIIERIANLRAGLVPDQEFSTLTYIDDNVLKLQNEREQLLAEKKSNLQEIDRLRAEMDKETRNLSPEERADIERRITSAKNERAGLLDELNNLRNRRNELISRTDSATPQTEETVFSGIDDTHNPQSELERIANELGIDASELRIDWHDGAIDYGDNVATEFDIVRVKKESEPILTDEERMSLENELAELQSELASLSGGTKNFDTMSISDLNNEIEAQIRALTDQIVENNQSYANTDRRMEANEPLFAKRSELQAQRDSLNSIGRDENDEIDAQIRALTDQIVENNQSYANTDRRMEANEPLLAKRAELQAQKAAIRNKSKNTSLDDLNKQIRELTDQIVENNQSYANTDRRMEANEPLLAKRAELEKQRDLLSTVKGNLNENIDSKRIDEIENRINEINGIIEADNQRRNNNPELQLLDEQILNAEARIRELDDVINNLENPEIANPDNLKRIEELEKRNQEIDARIVEIDRDLEGIPGSTPVIISSKETLDVEKEAHRIGDHIFKTAEIRRELASRDITRDEFVEFYKAGYNMTDEQIHKLDMEYKKCLSEIQSVYINPSDLRQGIDKQIEDAEKEGDTSKLISLNEQLRKNFIDVGREEQLKEVGLDKEIVSLDDASKMKLFYAQYKDSVERGLSSIRASVEELKENATIFAKEIERINDEKTILDMAGNSIDDLEKKSESRKKLRRELLEASITPKNKLTDEQKELLDSWQSASERFLDQKTTKTFKYIDQNGEEKTIEVDTIDTNYPEYEKDMEFLGVDEYRENLEQVSAWKQTKDPSVFGEEVLRAYRQANAERDGAGDEVIDRILADKQKYVETFNGIPNPHKVKYENWRTAGSTLKSMQPVNRNLPIQTRTKNMAENVGRFFGFRVPKFTKIDEHGNEVKDVLGGVGTIATDVAVGAMIVASPALMGTAYAAKGIVVAANRVTARIEYARHKDEIDNNKPVINQADRNSREVARKEFYREQGDNRFVSWVKAKSDKYITRGREKKTELAIVDKLAENYSEIEDRRVESLKENIEIANANQEARLRRQKQIAMGANTYNDIIRDPDSINLDDATAAIARNAAIESVRPGKGIEDVNSKSNKERKSQYVKANGEVARTADLDMEALEEKATGPVSAITEEQIYTGRKQKVDRVNKVLVALTTGALRFGYNAWKDGFIKEEVIHHDAEYTEDVIHHDAEYKDEIVYHDSEVIKKEIPDFETRPDTSKTLEEIMKSNQGKQVDGHYSVSGGIRGTQSRTIGDERITAAWMDDKSAWGTGISDTSGLSAPVLTDRLADADLIDSAGVLKQNITIEELLNATGASTKDLSNLDGIYVSVGDNYWTSLSKLMEGMTREVQVGSHIEEIVQPAWSETVRTVVQSEWDEQVINIVKEASDEVIKSFDSGMLVDTIRDGVVSGAALGTIDQLHESFQNTYINGATPGRPEETTKEARDTYNIIADKLFEQAAKERQAKEARQSRNELDGEER